MTKTKDIFLNIAANPNMTLEDLVSVGLTSENTVLLDRAQYASNERVQDMFRDENGNFDEASFNTFYDIAEQSYNILAQDEVNLNLISVTAYDADNIFVDPSKRTQNNAPVVVKLPNPDRLNVGVTRIGKIGPRTLSQDEIAQTQKVLLNPVEVANGAKPVYGDSPNDSWFEDFWDTKVMAAWDEDGVHIDPITGKEVQHLKGDLKLNENGTYYYESLDGRSVYGKRILNKFNTLTTDGSAWNKYDFFDSDSIEQKSIGGSILKNLALVGSMFIPYVGWGVAAASVAHQMAGLTATFGKMLAGSDSPALNALEGWVKSTDRRNLKTEYAQQNMWCWENFIDLVGDTTAQLREQRAIFKFAPGIIKGNFKALDEKAMARHTEKVVKESMENLTDKSFNDLARLAHKQNPVHWKEQFGNLTKGAQDIITTKAEKAARNYISNYYKLGELIARAYMTAITVQDTFGEAIQAGATDTEATLLTLGYAAAEAALLSTNLGKWIMPELRMERQRAKTIAKKLLELPKETRDMSRQLSRLEGEAKKDWAKRLFNVGKDIFTAEYSMMKKTAGTVLAQGLGEGIEEVSEEALADFSKSCFNVVQQLQGDDTRLNAWNHNWSWSEAANRYGMSFAGGILGGGINAAASDFKGARDLMNMDSQKAMQQLVYMVRNNEMDNFWKVVNKTTLASTELSTQLNDNGIGYKQGTKDDNQDLEAKRFLRKQVSLIESILNAESGTLDDGGLLSTLIKADPSLKDLDPVKEYRMRALANSATAGRFLNEYNTIESNILKNRMEQHKIVSKYGDSGSEKYSEEDKEALKNLGKDLKVLQDSKKTMLEGGRTREYVRDALFEMTHAVKDAWDTWATEVRFAEAKSGKIYKDLSEEQKQKLKEQYEALKSSNEYAEQIHELANIYETLATSASNGIKSSAEYLEKIKQDGYKNVVELEALTQYRLNLLQRMSESENGIMDIQTMLNDNYFSDLSNFDNSDELQGIFEQIQKETQDKIDSVVNGRNYEELAQTDLAIIAKLKADGKVEAGGRLVQSVFDKVIATCDQFIGLGFIHPETKNMLGKMMESLKTFSGQALEHDIFSYEEAESFDQKYGTLLSKLEELDKLSSTPILENLKQFQTSTTVNQNVLGLIAYLINKENKESSQIDTFQLDKVTLDQSKDARHLLELYRSAIVGARYDNIDLDHIVGFNTTLNELSGDKEKPELAEIDAQTADLILSDINTLLKRLDYAEKLHTLNSGNKYNVQNKTALNKQFILFNKTKQFISTIQDDDDWKDEEGKTALADLQAALNNASTLSKNSNEAYQQRNFALSPEEKFEVEKESLNLMKALHKFFNDNIDGSEKSINKLAKLLTYDNFKGLIRPNDSFLNQDSQDIDDSAFIWWLCSVAALDPNQFYNTYRYIIGEEADGEKPIAPLPTQELGVYALTASIVNGNMFRTFGKALRQSLNKTWSEGTPEVREQIRNEYGSDLLSDDMSDVFKNVDFLPNFDNIVFIEGIAGSGKSTGVLKTWSKLLAKANPDFTQRKVLIAHTNKEKADVLGKSIAFTNFEAHDHDSLLSWMSPDYKNVQNNQGESYYELGKDVNLVDGILRSNWELQVYDSKDIPSVIIIDEWSHYNQLEQELIQRFAQTYGVTVVAMGDYDQLTPKAYIKKGDNKRWLEITPNRNMTSRVAKLGVSMRTDNEIKNGNMYSMLAWKQSPEKSSVVLHYYEDDSGIYGEKGYFVDRIYGDTLSKIKADVEKMIKTLKEGESIGYIYHDVNSELYKWLTTAEGIKEHITPYTEKDAHGREAQYYIVENNRNEGQDALDYFSSVYTGITRSEQGSIVIAPTFAMKNASTDKYNSSGLQFSFKQDSEMQPNTFTDAGTREFSRKRKEILDRIFPSQEIISFNIVPRNLEPVDMDSKARSDESPRIEPPKSQEPPKPTESSTTKFPTKQSSTSEELLPPPENIPNEVYERIDLSQIPPTRTPEEISDWQGPLKQNQILYSASGIGEWVIVGEGMKSEPVYVIRNINTSEERSVSKAQVHERSFLTLPKEDRLFNVGQKLLYNKNVVTVDDITLDGPKDNPTWLYHMGGRTFTHSNVLVEQSMGDLFPYIEPDSNKPVEGETTAYEVESQQDFIESVDEQFADEQPTAITSTEDDINFNVLGFTFNTQYFGDEFDEKGNLVQLPQGVERIDNGYGLYGIDQARFKSKKQIQKVLGEVRRHLQFSSNADILRYLQITLRKKNLSIQWAFVSKSKIDPKTSGKYSRFNYPNAQLENMQKEDYDVPNKTISAIIYDDTGKPILELPIITLQSPHSIFKELYELGIGSDIVNLWKFGKKAPKETYKLLNNIIEHINVNHSNHPGYQKLGKLLKLWLFTSNGVKIIKNPQDPSKAWNLHEFSYNLGNLYITERYADDRSDYDFKGQWVDLNTIERSDRFISSIFMNNTDQHVDPSTGRYFEIFRPFVPYVLISDHPNINNDTEAVKQYLKQQANPQEEEIVKAIPAVAPEVSVSEYIKAMSRIIRLESTFEPYGNDYSPYRIWEAVLASPKANEILSYLSDKDRAFVVEHVTKLTNIKSTNPIQEGESNLAYKKRIAGLQNEVLKKFEGEGANHGKVLEKLRKALVSYNFFGTDEKINDTIIQLIQEACDSYGITGILCHPSFAGGQDAQAIEGVAYKVRVQNTYEFPGSGSFRIFGKIDTPTYNMYSLIDNIVDWADDAVLGVERWDNNLKKMVKYDNVWGFTRDDASEYYLSPSTTSRINLSTVLTNSKNLLAKLGITDYNIDISELSKCDTEAKAMAMVTDMINRKYLEQNGAFVIKMSNGTYKYGNIITNQTSEFASFKFNRFYVVGNKNILEFTNLATNTVENIEIGFDLSSDSFLITPKTASAESNAVNIAELRQEIETSVKNSVLWKFATDEQKQTLENVFECYNIETNVVDVNHINQILEEAQLGIAANPLRKTLKLDKLQNEQQQDLCINPIKISFK